MRDKPLKATHASIIQPTLCLKKQVDNTNTTLLLGKVIEYCSAEHHVWCTLTAVDRGSAEIASLTARKSNLNDSPVLAKSGKPETRVANTTGWDMFLQSYQSQCLYIHEPTAIGAWLFPVRLVMTAISAVSPFPREIGKRHKANSLQVVFSRPGESHLWYLQLA
jgi:hypothetical protein